MNYVLCLKYGTKYSSEYVNKLYNMVKRNLTLNYEFVCITENPTGLNQNIRVIELQQRSDIEGWWYKIMVFDPNFVLNVTVLFLDLDLIIFENIDKLFTFKPGNFCIIEDYYTRRKKIAPGMNSSVFRFETGTHTNIFTDFIYDPNTITTKLAGDQDWINLKVKDHVFWPHDWIISFKWEMMEDKKINKCDNKYYLASAPKVKKENCIAVFHGEPNPHQVEHEWCKSRWR